MVLLEISLENDCVISIKMYFALRISSILIRLQEPINSIEISIH